MDGREVRGASMQRWNLPTIVYTPCIMWVKSARCEAVLSPRRRHHRGGRGHADYKDLSSQVLSMTLPPAAQRVRSL